MTFEPVRIFFDLAKLRFSAARRPALAKSLPSVQRRGFVNGDAGWDLFLVRNDSAWTTDQCFW